MEMAMFRAVEDGFSMVRAAGNGISAASDYHGHFLSKMDQFTTDEQLMFADVPTQGVKTIYSRIGDVFSWMCLIGFFIVIGLAVIQSRAA